MNCLSKRSVKSMWRREFTGLGPVYRFTLIQQLKNRSNLISLLILLTMSLLSMPLLSLFGGSGSFANMMPEESVLTAVIVSNQTALPIQPHLTDSSVAGVALTTEDVETLADTAARVTISRDESGYLVTTEGGTEVETSTLSELGTLAQRWLQTAQLTAAGVSTTSAAALQSDVQTGYVGGIGDYMTPDEDELGFDLRFLVTYVYAILVMILCTYTATYIVRIIVEEKSSKLVELLMVSVQPLALVLGKILAMMTYIFGMFLAMAGCFGLSSCITRVMGGDPNALLGGLDLSLLRLDAWTIVIVVVSLLLAYAGFALLAGLAGTCCSRNEDVEAATGTVMFTVLAGYMVSCATGGIPSSGLALFVSLCPVVNVFCAPAQYVTGNINLIWLIVSWVEQVLIVAGLAWLTARVYRQLILSRGSRIKLRQLLAMAKQGKEAQA